MKRRSVIIVAFAALVIIALVALLIPRDGSTSQKLSKVRLRLQWVPQSQFAGFIVAKEKGFFKEAGLDVELLPAGPDLKPQVTVAAGTDDIGIGVPNHIITARSNGVPLVAIAQVFQDSPNRYVLKSANRIKDIRELRGKKIGLWLGGDEAEFVSMLDTVGMTLADIKVIPQEFSVIPFLQDSYVLSQVTVYNELIIIREKGYEGDKLQVLSPKDYNSAILGDVVFTTEKFLASHRNSAKAFVEASLKGWGYCLDHPDDALDIVLKYNPELEREPQRLQLQAVLNLLTEGAAKQNGIGYIDSDDYANAERVLLKSGQLSKHVNPKECIDISTWNAVPISAKRHP